MFRFNILFVVLSIVFLSLASASAKASGLNPADVARIAGQMDQINKRLDALTPSQELTKLRTEFEALRLLCTSDDSSACGNRASRIKTIVARSGLSEQAKADLAAALDALREGIKADVTAVVTPEFNELDTAVASVKADTEEIKSLVRKPRASEPCNETLTLLSEGVRTKEELVQSHRCLGDGRRGRNEIALAAIKRGAGVTIVGESIFVDEKFEDPNWSLGTAAAVGFLGGFAGGVGYVAAYDPNRKADDDVHFGPYVETGLVSGAVGALVGAGVALAYNAVVD